MGRIYWKAPGVGPLQIEYFDAPEVRDMALEICSHIDRFMLEGHIHKGEVIFMRSDGRRETSMKGGYVHALKGATKVLVQKDWTYCVEITRAFYELKQEKQYEYLLGLLKRIPEQEELTGKLVRFNSFAGFDQELDQVREMIKEQ